MVPTMRVASPAPVLGGSVVNSTPESSPAPSAEPAAPASSNAFNSARSSSSPLAAAMT